MALLKAQFYKAGDEFGGLGQVVLDQGIGDAEGIIALRERIVGAFQVGQCLVMVCIVVGPVDLDIETGGYCVPPVCGLSWSCERNGPFFSWFGGVPGPLRRDVFAASHTG